MQTRLKKIGFEIEGEFSTDFMNKLKQIGIMKGDGSVRRCENEKCRNLQTAEFNSHPFEVNDDGLQKIDELFLIFQDAYQKKEFHFNNSAGFHIHTSYTPEFPPDIFSVQFADFFRHALTVKQKSAYNRRRTNRFCRSSLSEEEISRDHGDRYKFINLWGAFKKLRTVEFRIFPANTPKSMLRYVLFTIEQINLFLAQPIEFHMTAEIVFQTKKNEQHEYTANANKLVVSRNENDEMHEGETTLEFAARRLRKLTRTYNS